MQICLSCVNKLENDEEDEEEMDICTDDHDVTTILRTFIDDEGDTWVRGYLSNIDPWADTWAPFGPGPRITAETIFF